jgi:hypothetical protein
MGMGEWSEDKVKSEYNLVNPPLRDTTTGELGARQGIRSSYSLQQRIVHWCFLNHSAVHRYL